MGVISGVGGSLDNIAGLGKWSISQDGDVQSYANSGTGGAMARIVGNKDWSGSYRAYGHTPYVMPGEAFSFAGSMDGTNGASGTSLAESIEVTCDIEGGKPLEHAVNFSGNGALTLGAVSAGSVAANMALPSIGCKVQRGTLIAEPVWASETDVRSWKLALSKPGQAYAGSDTAGVKKRVAGNLEGSVSWSVYCDDLTDLPTVGSVLPIRLFVSATEFWEIKWVMVSGISDIDIDLETGALIGATVNADLNFVTEIAESDTIGLITLPSTTVWWPTPA